MENFRITIADFHPWLKRISSNQANFRDYTLKFVSTEFEFAFADLRYLLEDYRPS